MTVESDLEKKIEAEMNEEFKEKEEKNGEKHEEKHEETPAETPEPILAAHVEEKVECLCVHGGCREGEATCDGACESGWSGPHCDTPVSDEKL
jgi:hypothetical protein